MSLLTCGPTGPGNPATDAQSCPAGQLACGGTCVDTSSDPMHCGSCDSACTGGQVCDGAGSCSSSCPGDTSNCGGACVNTNFDVLHCGVCDNACATPSICNMGTCQDDSCTEASSEAQRGQLPADIILVVDNSGSMTDEAVSVQASMNSFASIIIGSGIDAHVILISDSSADEQGVCVPTPLGSGACPSDEKLPGYRHVVTSVGSSNSLQLILDTYPQWQSSLRPNATKTLAVISDDDSSLGATAFANQLVALDPTFAGFKFDAIVAPYDPNGVVCFPCQISGNCASCDPCCGLDSALGLLCTALPADQGAVYQALVQTTGGVEGNLCTQDFLPAFQDMATAVVQDAQVACLYDIPDPANGMAIDYNRVNVDYQPNAGSPGQTIPHVPGGEQACGPNGGWYYDAVMPPTQVILCPATCSVVQANLEAKITVKFGCATIVE